MSDVQLNFWWHRAVSLILIEMVGWAFLSLAAFISIVNFYLSFVRIYVFRLLKREYHWVSGIPAFGSIFLILAMCFLSASNWKWIVAAVLAALDTGGLPWFAVVMIWMHTIGIRSHAGDGSRSQPPPL